MFIFCASLLLSMNYVFQSFGLAQREKKKTALLLLHTKNNMKFYRLDLAIRKLSHHLQNTNIILVVHFLSYVIRIREILGWIVIAVMERRKGREGFCVQSHNILSTGTCFNNKLKWILCQLLLMSIKFSVSLKILYDRHAMSFLF